MKSNGDSLANPAAGMWYREQPDGDFTIGVSTRSLKLGLLLIPFVLIWCGVSLGKVHFSPVHDEESVVAMVLFDVLYLATSMLLIGVTVVTMFGKVEVTRSGDLCTIESGLWPLGTRKKLPWSTVRAVVLEGEPPAASIVLRAEGRDAIRFATGVATGRQRFLIDGLTQILAG